MNHENFKIFLVKFLPSKMEQVYRIKAAQLIEAIKETLKTNDSINLPKDADLLKTSHGKQYSPENPNWFYVRMASIVRYAMCKGTVSLKGLVKKYSCRKNAGVRPSTYARGSDFVIESAIEQLIQIGWFNFANKKDILTPTAKDVLGEIMEKNIPKDKVKPMLKSCKECFGCGGSIGVEASKDVVILQGDQTVNLRKHKDTIFEGFEIRSGENK